MKAGFVSRNKGILVALITLFIIEFIAHTVIRIPNPPPILMLTIIFAVYLGGMKQGLISAAITWLYTIYYFSIPGQLFHYTNESLQRIIVLTFVIPATAILVGTLKRRADLAFNLERDKAVLQAEIEERKKMEEALHGMEEKFRHVFELSNVGKSITLLTGEINVNKAFADMLGYTQDELRNKKWQELTPDNEIKAIQNILASLLSGEKDSVRFEKRYIHKNGSHIWADVSVAIHRDRDGKPLHFITTIVDITDKKAEDALKFLTLRYEAILASVPDIIMEVDSNKIYTWANKAGYEFFGDDVIGKEAAFYFEGEQETYTKVEPLFRGSEDIIYVESWQRRRDREKRLLAWWCHVLKGESGNVTGALSTARDITEHKRAEEELKRYTNELKRSNEELQQFAYIASHDLQEPLRMISSYLQLIERRYKGRLDKDANEFITFAVDGANRLQEMIIGLLAYSRIGTRGKPFEEVNSSEVLGKAISNLKITIEESGAIVTADRLPIINADENQLIQVFQNLISNSIKFKAREQPVIHVSAKQKDTEWVFEVKDNGIGISHEYKDRIFNIFQRLHGREYPGVGIGLSICRRIVERHGGRIWFESEIGKGTTFYFTIPIKGG